MLNFKDQIGIIQNQFLGLDSFCRFLQQDGFKIKFWKINWEVETLETS